MSEKALGIFGQFLRGKGIPKGHIAPKGGLPCIRYAEIYTIYGDVVHEFVSRVSKENAKKSVVVRQGDVLLPTSGETAEAIGKAVAYLGSRAAYAGGDTLIFRGHKQNPAYLAYALNAQQAVRQKISLATGSSVVHLYASALRNVKVWLPPLAEQERIAEILSDVDSAIAMTEKKLSLVIARNKRLMLEFATSKSADWKTKRLSEIVVIKKGAQLNRENFLRDGNYPVYNGGVTHSGHYNRWNTEANTLTISEGGNAGYVRYVAERFWSGGHCYTLEAKDKKTDTKLVYFLLKAKEREVMRLRVGSALKNIQAGDLSAFTIQLPPRKMGAKISKALSVAEQEQEIMLALIAALKRQKRGLMQQLLTGKIRVLPKNNKGGKK